MTIIASYNINDCKVLLADILITSKQENEEKPTLPTLGEINSSRVDSDIYIAGNLQKIQILSEYCVIAYAGSVSLAYDFIKILNNILKERTLLISDIESTYESIDKNSELAIIYLYNVGNEEIISGGLNCVNAISDVLGEVIYRGSGEQAITDYIKWLDKNTNIYRPSSDEVVAHAVSVAIQQTAQLQMAEISSNNTPESIRDYFGSGYEVVSFYNGKFNKIDLAYIFIELTYDPQTCFVNIEHPYLILSNYVENGFLVHERYQQKKHPHLADSDSVEYYYNKIFTPSLLNFNETIPTITQENKINDLNFCCFVLHDNFKNGTDIWQSIVVRSDTPPVSIKKCKEENFYHVEYSNRTEIILTNFVEEHYL